MAFIRMRRHDVEVVLDNIYAIEALIDGKAGSTREFPFYLHDELREAAPNIELIEKLIEGIPERVEISNQEGSIALHIACYNGVILEHGIEIIQFLIDAYPDSIKQKNKYGMLPIHKALSAANRAEQIPVLEYLIDAYPEGLTSAALDGVTPFHMLITHSISPTLEVIQYLIRRNPEILKLPDAYGQLPLHKAVILSPKRMNAAILSAMIEAFPFSACWKDSRG
jgi:ankyrin repeat protein